LPEKKLLATETTEFPYWRDMIVAFLCVLSELCGFNVCQSEFGRENCPESSLKIRSAKVRSAE